MNDLNFPRGTVCVERSVSGEVKWLAIENPKHFREWLGCFSIL